MEGRNKWQDKFQRVFCVNIASVRYIQHGTYGTYMSHIHQQTLGVAFIPTNITYDKSYVVLLENL